MPGGGSCGRSRATGRTAAAAHLTRFGEQTAALRRRVAPIAAAHPEVNIIYPRYRGGEEHSVFDETFGLSGNVSALGFDVVVPTGVQTVQGFASLSAEAFGRLSADTVLSVGVGRREDNAANRLLHATGANVAYMDIGLGRPPQGPLSDLFYMEQFAVAISALY